jgi:hypothetical protein
MLSALIKSERSYPAVPLIGQLVHQRFVHSGPLVLGMRPLNTQTIVVERDRAVLRRSEPS